MVQLILFTLRLKHLICDFLLLGLTQPIVETNLKWGGQIIRVYSPRGKLVLAPNQKNCLFTKSSLIFAFSPFGKTGLIFRYIPVFAIFFKELDSTSTLPLRHLNLLPFYHFSVRNPPSQKIILFFVDTYLANARLSYIRPRATKTFYF